MASYLIDDISLGADALYYPQQRKVIRTKGEKLVCIYHDNGRNLYLAYSTDGVTWTRVLLVDADTDPNCLHPSLAADDDDNIYVVWAGYRTGEPAGDRQIRAIVYYANGSLSSITNITDSVYDQDYPAIAIDGNGKLHVVWSARTATYSSSKIQYSCYSEGSWSTPVLLMVTGEASYAQELPSIAVDSNNVVHVVWYGRYQGYGTRTSIRYAYLDAGTWYYGIAYSDSSYNYYRPCIAIDKDNNLHVAFQITTTISNVLYIKKTAATGTWGDYHEITADATYNQYAPSISVTQSNDLHVIWRGLSSESATYYQVQHIKYSGSWGSIEALTNDLTCHNVWGNLIFSTYPSNDDIPTTGYAFIYFKELATEEIWYHGEEIWYYGSADLEWYEPPVPPTPPTPTPIYPVYRNSTTVMLGLAQIRIAESAPYIGYPTACLTKAHSLGAMVETRILGEDFDYILRSGFPQTDDLIIAYEQHVIVECVLREITPINMALMFGQAYDPTTYDDPHDGQIYLGTRGVTSFIRVEFIYWYPESNYQMHLILPKAYISTEVLIDWAVEDDYGAPFACVSTPSDSDSIGGHAIWDAAPLGCFCFL